MEIDKKKLFIFIGLAFIYLIVFVLIIMFIWFRNDNEKYLLKYNTYTEQEVFEKSKSTYCNELINFFALKRSIAIYNKLSSDFITSEGITKENIDSYLKNNGYYSNKVSAGSYEAYENLNNSVFIVDFKIGDNIKKVTIIEENYPGNYKITLGEKLYNSATSTVNKKETTSNGIKFNIEKTSSDIDGVGYNIEITNQNDEEVEFDFSSVLNVYLKTSERTCVYLNDVIAESTDIKLTKNSRINKKLYFIAGAEIQSKINKLIFENVRIGNEFKTVEVNL